VVDYGTYVVLKPHSPTKGQRMIDKALQKYYEDRFSLFSTPGWQDLMEDAQKMFDALNQVLPIQNEADLHLKRGQLDILNWILSLKSVSEQSYEQLMSGDSSA
jgi:CMP-N-acetylneuraminic acid synthetase